MLRRIIIFVLVLSLLTTNSFAGVAIVDSAVNSAIEGTFDVLKSGVSKVEGWFGSKPPTPKPTPPVTNAAPSVAAPASEAAASGRMARGVSKAKDLMAAEKELIRARQYGTLAK